MYKLLFIFLFGFFFSKNIFSQPITSSQFKTPLSFYNTDILKYLQILYKNQQYDEMSRFFYNDSNKKMKPSQLVACLAKVKFGYTFNKAGINIINKKHWFVTYQRTIIGTTETFSIECKTINDTCKINLDTKTWRDLFER